MDLESMDDATVRLSVPTRFLKSWIQSHYAERVLACWQAEQSTVGRIELSVRSGILRSLAKPAAAEPAVAPREIRELRFNGSEPRGMGSPLATAHEALGGSPLDPRLTFDTFIVGRSNTLAHAAAKQVAAARRSDPVMFNPL
jgi:chromosomal replication initiator protein